MPLFTPQEIVAALDKYIIGQDKAKKAVAIALRNRWRRKQVPPPLRDGHYSPNYSDHHLMHELNPFYSLSLLYP